METATQIESRVLELMEAGQLRDAALACDRLNQRFPDYEPGWLTACRLAMRVNEPRIAVRALDRALALSPGRPVLLLQRIECLAAAGDVIGARAVAEKLLGYHFPGARETAAFAHALHRLGLVAEAGMEYGRCCELEPDTADHWYNLATVERFLGHVDAAEAALGRCLELRPNDVDAHWLRAGLRTRTAECNNIDALSRAHASVADGRGRSRLCYALAKELEDLGEFERSFAYLAEGAKLRRAAMRYTPEKDLAVMTALRNTFTKAVFDGDIHGHASAEPIFVIGMPRTGTTLVERILGSHSVVESAGELQTFAVELVRACQNRATSAPPDPVALVGLSRDVDFEALGEAYVSAARPPGARGAHFIDKLPLNYLYAGPIHLALPNAKIVVLERDPMDTCYAVFKALFEGIYPFSYDLTELANYFVAYRALMSHWQAVMPGVMHTVNYEKLVSNPKPVIQDLLDYCNLSYEDACLDFHKNPSAAMTASAVQVRSGFSTGSVGNWRNYREQLEPVERILQQAGII